MRISEKEQFHMDSIRPFAVPVPVTTMALRLILILALTLFLEATLFPDLMGIRAVAGEAQAKAAAETITESVTEATPEGVSEKAGEAVSEQATEKPAAASVPGLDSDSDPIILRVCNWEEYLDFGDWDEPIDLESGDIIGINHMKDDFEEWYLETYGREVKVAYSAFGTNEDLYNMLTLGDEYDVVCPSEYMFMKLMVEDKLEPFSDAFFDETDEYNYYTKGLSPYIKKIFDEHEVNGEPWSKYAAGYMWGITGYVYNAEALSREEVSSWKMLADPAYYRQVTMKDNVRDAYFAAVGAIKSDLLTDPAFKARPDYEQALEAEMNDVSDETIRQVQDFLQDVKDNAYSFETDAGKADLITGKVLANLQWSGDAVYTMDQAEEDSFTLDFAVPEEASNIYFDGWVMLKDGVGDDPARKHAAEAFINYVSRPDNVIRNMYYVGYTSVISGGEDDRIFEYADWSFGAEEDEEDTVEYSLDYFFSEDPDGEEYVLTVPRDSLTRQLGGQYPDREWIARSSIMDYFDDATNEKINQMWIRVRCYNIKNVPVWVWVLVGVAVAALVVIWIRKRRRRKLYQ